MTTPAVLAASDTGKGSPIGLFVVLVLVIATYLLYRSMSGHIRRLPEKFPGYSDGSDEPAGTDVGATAGSPAASHAAEQPVASPPPSQSSQSSQSDPTRSGPERP